MLQTETINESTLELLKRLMRDDVLRSFCLVGGTAAALQMGHRISIDLDLFTQNDFDTESLVRHLTNNYNFNPSYIAKNTVKGEIEGVKIDCITHPYPMIEKIYTEDGMRLANLKDIAAMKLNAIVNSGERIKDFIDLAWLSKYYTLQEMLDAYEFKYKMSSLIPLRAISYWEDIDFQEPVHMKDGKLDWKKIQKRIEWMIKNPIKK